jgi:hypothetical protein
MSQVATFSSSASPLMPSLSSELVNGNSIKLICQNAPIEQTGGRWSLGKSTDLQSWQELPSVTQATLAQNSSITLPIEGSSSFFRLSWKPN